MYTVESTGTTPNGTAYSICVETVGANVIRWGVPTAKLGMSGLHGLLYAHGSGGSDDYFTTRPIFSNTRNLILDNGGFWMECTGSEISAFGGQNNWNREIAKIAYSNAVQLVYGYLPGFDLLILGRSMGALVALWLATQDSFVKNICSGVIHMSGIYSMLDEFDDGNHFGLPGWYGTTAPPTPPTRPDVPFDSSAWASWRTSLIAWRALSGTVTARDALAAATPTNDPARYDNSLFVNLNVMVIYGTKDNVAWSDPDGLNIAGLKFWQERSAVFAPTSELVAVAGATHDLPGTFDTPEMKNFILRTWGIEPEPPTPGGYLLGYASYMLIDSTWRPMTNVTTP